MINVAICGIDDNKITQYIEDEIPVIIVKNFEKESVCNNVRQSVHFFKKQNSPKLGDRFTETFWQISVLPSKAITDRIFRTCLIFPDDELPVVNLTMPIFKKMESFQKKYLGIEKFINDKVQGRPQIIHYPIGGGFFDWHTHPRFPTNYGLILNLSKNKNTVNLEISDNGQGIRKEISKNICQVTEKLLSHNIQDKTILLEMLSERIIQEDIKTYNTF